MAAEIRCPRCGAANRPDTAFCVNCGSPLAAGATGTAPMPPPYPSGAPGYPSFVDQGRQKQIDRTKTGVLLLLVGSLLTWIPFIGLLGSLLILIGAILVILGRKAFGPAHARNVTLSIVLFFLGIIIGAVGAVVVFASTFAAFGQTPTPATIQGAFNNFLIVLVIAGIVGGLAQVFFTFALQNQTGRMLLLAAYVAGVVVAIAVWVVMSGAIAELIATACPGGTCSDAAAAAAASTFQGRVASLGLLNAIPSLLYAGAYYLVWNRIKSGEIPGPAGPPGMAPPPMAPIQPQ